MELNERDLCRKLLTRHHLSDPERRALPSGQARFSVLVAAVREALAESGWFPFELIPGRDIGEGMVLESRDGEPVSPDFTVQVDLDSSYGVAASFQCARAEVVSVEMYEPPESAA